MIPFVWVQYAAMFQSPPGGINSWSELNALLTIIALLITALLAYIVAQMRLQIARNISELKDEINKNYVPNEMDRERRGSLTLLLDEQQKELKEQRKRTHDLAGQFTTLIVGKLERIENQLIDKTRRMAHIETKLESNDELQHSCQRELLELKRCVQDVTNRLHNLELRNR